VRTRLKGIERFLEENNFGVIEKKQRVGVWLNASSEQRRNLEIAMSDSTSEFYIQDSEKRVNEVIRTIFLMKPNSPMTIINMASAMYLSVPTMIGIFKQAVEWFEEKGIKVYGVRNKGICVEATEVVYRRALKQFILKGNDNKLLQEQLERFTPGLDVIKVRKLLLKTEEQWRLSFSDYSFKEIWVCLSIAIYRMNRTKAKIEISKVEEEKIFLLNEYAFAQTLFERVEKEFAIDIEQNEVLFLAKEILSANFMGGNLSDSSETGVLGYDLKLREFVGKLIGIISAIIDEELLEDQILYCSLLQHIGPAIFRLRYRNDKSETILGYVKNDYKKVYRAAWATSLLFEEFFDVQVTEDELIYITLYVQVALERKSRPLHAVLVTQTGLGHSQLLCEKIKKWVPQIKEIDIARVEGFEYEKCAQGDIVLSTASLPYKVPNMIQIDLAMSDDSVMKLRKQVNIMVEDIARREERLDCVCYALLQPKLMFTAVEANSKEEVIRFLADKLEENGYVSRDYYESVMKREQATTTAIGNGVAIPHGFASGINESKVCICTLKEPIPWNNEMVDVIFFLAVRMKTPQEMKYIQLFYKHFIRLTATDEKVDILRRISSGAEMYKYLIG
jgi:mannitol/fructose-specific phosphotransferase system IIA component (Ntr-type)